MNANPSYFSFPRCKHIQLGQAIGRQTYFAKTYHLWERGLNENAIGLLGQYYLKAVRLLDVTIQNILEVVHKLTTG